MGDNYMVDEEIESLLKICKTMLDQMHELDMRHRDIDSQLALPLWEGVSCERCKSIHGGVRLYKDNIEEFLMSLNRYIKELEQLAFDFKEQSVKSDIINTI